MRACRGFGWVWLLAGLPAWAQNITVSDSDQLLQALHQPRPGMVVLLEPGNYRGNIHVANLRGTGEAPIVLRAADPARPPVIQGGGEGLKIRGAAYLEIHDLILEGARNNGLNIDDGDNPDQPAQMILLQNITVRDLHPDHHAAGIKLSGVYDFEVRHGRVERWGLSAAGIDMVGCHRGRIVNTLLRGDPAQPSAVGIQAKGGSTAILIQGCRFEHAGRRGVNIGGRTGRAFFRPRQILGYEARDVTIQGCLFIGAEAPIVFATAQDGLVRFNTFYHPGKWIARILQDAQGDLFQPCGQGVFTDNLIVFRSDQLALDWAVNIGVGVRPESFTFARNYWYCENDPARSRIRLPPPLVQMGDRFGPDPRLADPAQGDFTLEPGSPARGFGHTAIPEEE